MKKNKTLAFMLAASLLVGGTFVGTKAWFTAETQATNDLVITMGDLNVEAYPGEWNIISTNTEGTVGGNGATNLKPGDRLEKVVEVKNTGSLEQIIEVGSLEEINGMSKQGFTSSLKDMNNEALEGPVELGPNEKVALFKIVVEIDQDLVGGKYNETGDTNWNTDKVDSIDFNEIFKPIVITAEQTNANIK